MPSVGSTPTTTSPAPQQTQSQQPQQQQPQQQQQQTSAPAPALALAPVPVPATAPVAKRRHTNKTNQQQQQPQPQPHKQPQQQRQRQQKRQQQQQQPLQLRSQHHKLPLQLQLQYQHYQPQQSMATVTTTQPTPAGVFSHNNNINHNNINNNNNASSSSSSNNSHSHNSGNNNNNNDMSPISNSNSYSSVDTNQTLLNSIANCQRGHNQRDKHQPNRKYSQFMIITPAVSIDRDFEYESHLDFEDFANAAHNNGNLFRLGLRRSDSSSGDDSGHSSDSSFRSNYNPYLHHSRQHLLSNKSRNGGSSSARRFYAFSSWRWCTLLCAAMRCFGAGGHGGQQAPYSSSYVQHHRLRRCSSSYNADTAYDYEHFAAPFKARKTRDHLNNITYEL